MPIRKWDQKAMEADVKLVCNDINALSPKMLEMVKILLVRQPMVVPVETRRSDKRQFSLYKSGASKTNTSLHEEGDALDYIHKTLGYNAPREWWMGIRKTWVQICKEFGIHKVAFPSFELGHISRNNGTRC